MKAIYFVRRLLTFVLLLVAASILVFAAMQLPPGDALTSYIARLEQSGVAVDEGVVAELKTRYGLDQPLFVQYFKWSANMLRGDFGMSFEWSRPVSELIWERLGLTALIALCSLLVSCALALPIGAFLAAFRHPIVDAVVAFLETVGKAIPGFLLAVVLMWIGFSQFGLRVGGLFSPEYIQAPWSGPKVVDLLKHLWLPVAVLSVGNTATMVRTMHTGLLDKSHGPQGSFVRSVLAALSRALPSAIGHALPALISNTVVVAIVLNLQTAGPLLLRALYTQDTYLAGGLMIVLFAVSLLVTLVSDLLLGGLDLLVRGLVARARDGAVAPKEGALKESVKDRVRAPRRQIAKTVLGVAGLVIVVGLCAIAVFGKFLAPHDPQKLDLGSAFAPPQPMHLLGTDRMGRDVLSRLIVGTRTTLLIGLASATIGVILGTIVGGPLAYLWDMVGIPVQHPLGFLHGIPKLVLCMALCAALPVDWPPLQISIGVMLILLLVGWTEQARVMRAERWRAKEMGIPLLQMLPSLLLHLVAALFLSVPAVILGETTLSFLGLGIRPPGVSWGVQLQGTQNLHALVDAPWILIPGIAVVITAISFTFLGDWLRCVARSHLPDASRSVDGLQPEIRG